MDLLERKYFDFLLKFVPMVSTNVACKKTGEGGFVEPKQFAEAKISRTGFILR